MRFMVMVKATKESEAGVMPSEQLLAEMGAYNEELVKAGVMLAGEGLHPSSKGVRVRVLRARSGPSIDGPFAETKELVAGFWLLQVRSKDEVIEWVRRCPNPFDGESEIEIRQVFEAEDFGEAFTPELRAPGGAAASRLLPQSRDGAEARRRAMIGGGADPSRAIETVWQRVAEVVAGLTRIVRDLAAAEDLAHDALAGGARAVAHRGHPAQPGRLADGGGEAPRHRPAPPARRGWARKHEELARDARGGQTGRRRRTSRPPWTTTSATTCCA